MREIYDPIRKMWVAATPEEIVRQKWLYQMVQQGFPQELIVIERELKLLPHLQGRRDLPQRRVDILSYRRGIAPLLLIECKKTPLTQQALDQALAYNSIVQAEYVAIVNEQSIFFHGKNTILQKLPAYEEL